MCVHISTCACACVRLRVHVRVCVCVCVCGCVCMCYIWLMSYLWGFIYWKTIVVLNGSLLITVCANKASKWSMESNINALTLKWPITVSVLQESRKAAPYLNKCYEGQSEMGTNVNTCVLVCGCLSEQRGSIRGNRERPSISVWNCLFCAPTVCFRLQWAVLKCRSPASRLPAMFKNSSVNINLLTEAQSFRPITAVGYSGLKATWYKTDLSFKDAEIRFAEINSARIKKGISSIQACNPILVVPPNSIINPKKALYGIFNLSVWPRLVSH